MVVLCCNEATGRSGWLGSPGPGSNMTFFTLASRRTGDVTEIRSRKEFDAHLASELARERYRAEQGLAHGWRAESEAWLEAYCAACNAKRPLLVDHVASTVDENDNWLPNWRERLICKTCGLNTRQRLMIDHLVQVAGQGSGGAAGRIKALCHRANLTVLRLVVGPYRARVCWQRIPGA